VEITRRQAIKLGLVGGAALTLPAGRLAFAGSLPRMAASRLPRPYTLGFVRPPLLTPVRSGPGGAVFALTMRASSTEILPGYPTTVLGYDGRFPGPTIEVERGTPVMVRHINSLPALHPTWGYRPDTSVHLHGSASSPEFDGYASDVLRPGQYKDYWYPNLQEARTLWYHDHAHHRTAQNVYSGLAGLHIVHDPQERSLPLPSGRYDVPLVVSDALFTPTGDLLWDSDDHADVFGDVILVNGTPWPAMPVERRKYRFRILNASISRTYRWQLDSGEPLVVVGTDAGLMPTPQPVQEFRHGNGERYEVVIDFARYPIGRRVQLRNLSTRNNRDEANTNKVMAFDVVAESTSPHNNAVPDVLNPHNPVLALDPGTATRTRRMELIRTKGRWTINGKTWEDVMRSGFVASLADPALDAVEIWDLRNDSGGWHHPFHIHLVDFRILDRVIDQTGAPRPPMPHELGSKDVAYLGENERVRVIARFGPHPGRYMVHCHNLLHEDHDMMGQFEVGRGGADPMTTAPARNLPAPPL
jgi:spore coat protein A, manganese oxidase